MKGTPIGVEVLFAPFHSEPPALPPDDLPIGGEYRLWMQAVILPRFGMRVATAVRTLALDDAGPIRPGSGWSLSREVRW